MCESVSSLFDTLWHTWLLCLLFGRRARTRCLWGGNLRALWAVLYKKALFSSVPLFEERGSAVCFPRSGTHRDWGTEEKEIVGLAGGSGRWVRRGSFPSRTSRPGRWTRASRWIMVTRSLWRHLIRRLVLCWVMPRKSRRCVWGMRKLRLNSLKLLPCVRRAVGGYGTRHGEASLAVGANQLMAAPPGRLVERYLSGHKPSAQVSLPFLPDLHTEVEREWKKPFSSRIHKFQHTSYANIARMCESGYERMPPVEETLASYLSMGDTGFSKGSLLAV